MSSLLHTSSSNHGLRCVLYGPACVQWSANVTGLRHRAGVRHAAARRARLAADTVVAGMFVAAHGAVLLCQGMAFSVAVNSARSYALIALLIASNFVEVKGESF